MPGGGACIFPCNDLALVIEALNKQKRFRGDICETPGTSSRRR